MSTLWIVHRDSRRRAALARAAAATENAVSGGPGDPLFDSAMSPDVVLLGLAGDLEAELEFAHRIASRFPEARWVLVAERSIVVLARELFDAIGAEILHYPPDTRTLRACLHRGPAVGGRLPLSMRPARDLLSQRFSRWFADLELPSLLQALDPQLGDSPLLIFGEEGTGRGLLARYVHGFGRGDSSRFAHVICTESMSGMELRTAIRDAAGDIDPSLRGTLWLDGADTLSIPTQQQLARWIEFELPAGTLRCGIARWIATVSDEFETEISAPLVPSRDLTVSPSLHPSLLAALSGVSIRIPSVRDRPHLIAPFANDTALAWCATRRQSPRRFGEDAIAVLEEYPWPGNLRELEAVVIQTLTAGAADPIRADDLQYDGTAFAPINAGEVGVLIETEDLQSFDEFDPTEQTAPTAPGASETPTAPIAQPAAPPQDPPSEVPTHPAGQAAPEPAVIGIQRLVGAIAHEIRNPLSTIRTFTELLPNRYDDPDFRETFTELVGQDARRLESVVNGLAGLAAMTQPDPARVNIPKLIEELLEQRRARVHERKLLVLKELETDGPPALVDQSQIRIALDSIFDATIELAPERGDVYVASRQHAAGLRGGPAVRVLVRFGNRAGVNRTGSAESRKSTRTSRTAGVSPAENALPFAIAEAIIHSQSGAFAINVAENDETVVVLDIPAALG